MGTTQNENTIPYKKLRILNGTLYPIALFAAMWPQYSKKNTNIRIPMTDNMIKIENIKLNNKKEEITKLILDIPQKGCYCNNKKRKYVSSIIGCGKSHGCNYDKFKCSICNKTYQYKSVVYHHIKWSHSKIVSIL